MPLFSKKSKPPTINSARLPKHIAIIMDGNGRWAKARGLPRTAGHAAGAETFRRIATYCKDIGVDYLTVYAFSTENWKRPEDEVQAIMGLLEKYLAEAIEKMERDGVRLKILGDTSPLSPKLLQMIRQTEAISARTQGMQANICVNYGGRDEIVHAARAYMRQGGKPEELTEAALAERLYSAGIPDPDLIIRPGGEYRTSNFLLWQSAYSELYFTDTLWPDFKERELDRAILAYQSRDRRFGGLK
ncbi:MAG: isoprenyl transferase [Oscillospiraceae bacterium]|nr:isoprenyl transferase [Oscillospiraceae bacterium]